MIGIVNIILVYKIENGKYFSINKNTQYVVFGHSHAECSFNDSLITNFENYGQSAESYFYTFFKAKKIIESNKQLKVVFIEFSNKHINPIMNEWIWGETYISYKYPKYESLMNFNDVMFLLSKNAKAVVQSQSLSIKENILFFSKKDSSFIKYKNWGGYRYLKNSNTEFILRILPENLIRGRQYLEISEINIQSLIKTIELCKKNGVKVFLIRCPFHRLYGEFVNELKFKAILYSQLSEVEFLDFLNLPLNNSEYADFGHLNYKGAKLFSVFFDHLLDMGLLDKNEKQNFINAEIDKLGNRCFE